MSQANKPSIGIVNSKLFGETAEAIFHAEVMKHNIKRVEKNLDTLHIAKPQGDNLPYDYLIGMGHKFLKIQIKSTNKKRPEFVLAKGSSGPKKGKRDGTGKDINGVNRRNGKRIYDVGDFDYVCCYHHKTGYWWIIPSSSKVLYSDGVPENGNYKGSLTCSLGEGTYKGRELIFNKYRNNWKFDYPILENENEPL